MLIKDYLNQYGTQAAYDLLVSTPFMWPLDMAVKSPKDIQHVCDMMGWSTIEQLNAWVQVVNSIPIPNREIWQKLCNPKPTLKASDLLPITWTEMDVARSLQCNTAADFQRMNSDVNYLCPTLAQAKLHAKENPSWRYGHLGSEILDCDDNVNISRGWDSQHRVGSLSASKAATRHQLAMQTIYGHAVRLIYTRETIGGPVACHWWEPQTGEIHPITYTRLGANWLQFPDRVELAWQDA